MHGAIHRPDIMVLMGIMGNAGRPTARDRLQALRRKALISTFQSEEQDRCLGSLFRYNIELFECGEAKP